MKRSILLFAAATILTAPMLGCSPTSHTHETHQVKHDIYHFADGSAGYQSNDGIWWYWIASISSNSSNSSNSGTSYAREGTSGGSASASASISPVVNSLAVNQAGTSINSSVRGGFGSSAQTYGATGGQWTKGPAPTEEELASATLTEETVTEDENSQPEAAPAPEAAPVADAGEGAAPAGGDGGGGGGGDGGGGGGGGGE